MRAMELPSFQTIVAVCLSLCTGAASAFDLPPFVVPGVSYSVAPAPASPPTCEAAGLFRGVFMVFYANTNTPLWNDPVPGYCVANKLLTVTRSVIGPLSTGDACYVDDFYIGQSGKVACDLADVQKNAESLKQNAQGMAAQVDGLSQTIVMPGSGLNDRVGRLEACTQTPTLCATKAKPTGKSPSSP